MTKKCKDPFKVVALMAVFNEEDIIYDSIQKLIDQKIHVYVIDNWSTDQTYEILDRFKHNPFFIGCERYPITKDSSDRMFNFIQILDRKSELASQLDADWFIHCDADEIRVSPWEELNLKEAIQYVDRMGFNAINHTVINFQAINNDFTSGDFEKYYKYFEFERNPGKHVKTWKKTEQKVDLSQAGGHQALFDNRRVAPYHFLLKHYPLRSQQHAEKKIFKERKPRYLKSLKKRGWHIQYDAYGRGDSFLRNPNELLFFSDRYFSIFYLVERLSSLPK